MKLNQLWNVNFEDSNGALELARAPKYRPRTKHIALKYHHFRNFVKEGKVEILPIDTKEQIADILTKAMADKTLFKYLRFKLLGWYCDDNKYQSGRECWYIDQQTILFQIHNSKFSNIARNNLLLNHFLSIQIYVLTRTSIITTQFCLIVL